MNDDYAALRFSCFLAFKILLCITSKRASLSGELIKKPKLPPFKSQVLKIDFWDMNGHILLIVPAHCEFSNFGVGNTIDNLVCSCLKIVCFVA